MDACGWKWMDEEAVGQEVKGMGVKGGVCCDEECNVGVMVVLNVGR